MNDDAIIDFCVERGIELLVLFGSVAGRTERPGSDTDLAVKMKRGRSMAKLELIYQLGALFPDHEVDLVVLSIDTDPVLLFEIYSSGKPLYEEKPGLFDSERLRAYKIYYDIMTRKSFGGFKGNTCEYFRTGAAMSPEVVKRKLGQMAAYLKDLRRHEGISFDLFMERHYEIERILELLVMSASDITLHLISIRGEPAPASYRAAFLRAGEKGIISMELSKRLALSAGLRNILVHEYEEIDYSILHESIPAAVADFSKFLNELS